MTRQRFEKLGLKEQVVLQETDREFSILAIDEDDGTLMDEFGTWYHFEDVDAANYEF